MQAGVPCKRQLCHAAGMSQEVTGIIQEKQRWWGVDLNSVSFTLDHTVDKHRLQTVAPLKNPKAIQF